MSEVRAIPTVYSYYFPQVRRIVDELVREYPHDVFLKSVDPGLDDFHKPIMEKYVHWIQGFVSGFHKFDHWYPTSGSSEGIREVLTTLAMKGVETIRVFDGEYEGFAETAKTRGIGTETVDRNVNLDSLTRMNWFISNPSAIDGNSIPWKDIVAICEAGHHVHLDLSYVGSCPRPERFSLDHENIRSVFVSFSKPYGLFYYRVGFLFRREEVPALYANKWFKSVFSLLLARKLMESMHPMELARTYDHLQKMIVAQMNTQTAQGFAMYPSDSILLAQKRVSGLRPEEAPEELRQFVRNRSGYSTTFRMCLTPYYIDLERRLGFLP